MFDWSWQVNHIIVCVACILNSVAIIYNARNISKMRSDFEKFKKFCDKFGFKDED